VQLGFQGGIIENAEPLMSMDIVANDLPGNSYTMHPAAAFPRLKYVTTTDQISQLWYRQRMTVVRYASAVVLLAVLGNVLFSKTKAN
jgi:hypothetical protein